MELLWKLEHDFKEELERRTNTATYNEITIKELLDLGFNNNILSLDDKDYELGCKQLNGEYCKDLTDEQLNVKVCMIDSYFDDSYDDDTDYNGYFVDTDGYHIARVELINEEDEKLFLKRSKEV